MSHIYYLSDNPTEAVQWLMDVDIIRMPIEIAQVLSTVSKRIAGINQLPGDTWAEWAVLNKDNYEELWNYAMDLLDEHYHRFGSRSPQQYRHGISNLIDKLGVIPSWLPEGETTEKPLSSEQGRLQYTEPGSFSTYTHREKPEWKI